MKIAEQVYLICNVLPVEEKFGLRSQLTRSAVSIPSNIAEGSSRKSNKDFSRYLEIALGSAFELETQLMLTKKLIKELNSINETIELVIEEQKMIVGIIKKLSN